MVRELKAAGGSAEDLKAALLWAVRLVQATLSLPSATHGANLFARSSLLLTMGVFQAELADFDLALETAAQAIETNPVHPRAYVLAVQLHSKRGDTDGVLRALDQLESVFGVACRRCHGTLCMGSVGVNFAAPCGEVDRALGMRSQLLGKSGL